MVTLKALLGTSITQIPIALSSEANLEQCRDTFEEVLEEWLLFRISRGLSIPVINGFGIEIKEIA
jgi:hypothetical protein